MSNLSPYTATAGDAKDPPAKVPEEGILLGYSLEHERRTAPIGFTYGSAERSRDPGSEECPTLDPILHTGGALDGTAAPVLLQWSMADGFSPSGSEWRPCVAP